MDNQPLHKLAQIMVDHSTNVKPGDRVAIETTTTASDIAGELFQCVLERGGYPHLILNLPEQDRILFRYGNDDQLAFTPAFQQLVTEQFEVYIRVRAEIDLHALRDVPAKSDRSHVVL